MSRNPERRRFAHVSQGRRAERYGGERSDKHMIAALNSELDDLPSEVQEMLKALEERVIYHRRELLKKQSRNGFWSVTFSWLIPVTAAVVTWIASPEISKYLKDVYVPSMLGLALTIVTILNATFRPAEKAMTSAHLLVQLHDWEMDLVAGIRGTLTPGSLVDKRDVTGFILRKDRELSKIGTEVAERFSPQAIGSKEPQNESHGIVPPPESEQKATDTQAKPSIARPHSEDGAATVSNTRQLGTAPEVRR